MPKQRTDFQKLAGKLISAIQKEWGEELGEPPAAISEDVMDAAHEILLAGSVERTKELLGALTVRQFLGEVWIQSHPRVKPFVLAVESFLNPEKNKS